MMYRFFLQAIHQMNIGLKKISSPVYQKQKCLLRRYYLNGSIAIHLQQPDILHQND